MLPTPILHSATLPSAILPSAILPSAILPSPTALPRPRPGNHPLDPALGCLLWVRQPGVSLLLESTATPLQTDEWLLLPAGPKPLLRLRRPDSAVVWQLPTALPAPLQALGLVDDARLGARLRPWAEGTPTTAASMASVWADWQARCPGRNSTQCERRLILLLAARRWLQFVAPSSAALVEAAERAALSRFHFSRLFHRVFGQTPADLLRSQVMRRAVARLQGADQPLWSVAQASGFSRSSALARACRRRLGCSPSELRDAPAVTAG